jgi:hypothetical protein
MKHLKLFESFAGLYKEDIIDIIQQRCLIDLVDDGYEFSSDEDYIDDGISIKVFGDNNEYAVRITMDSDIYVKYRKYLTNDLISDIKHFFNEYGYEVDIDSGFSPIMNPNNFQLVRRLIFNLTKK